MLNQGRLNAFLKTYCIKIAVFAAIISLSGFLSAQPGSQKTYIDFTLKELSLKNKLEADSLLKMISYDYEVFQDSNSIEIRKDERHGPQLFLNNWNDPTYRSHRLLIDAEYENRSGSLRYNKVRFTLTYQSQTIKVDLSLDGVNSIRAYLGELSFEKGNYAFNEADVNYYDHSHRAILDPSQAKKKDYRFTEYVSTLTQSKEEAKKKGLFRKETKPSKKYTRSDIFVYYNQRKHDKRGIPKKIRKDAIVVLNGDTLPLVKKAIDNYNLKSTYQLLSKPKKNMVYELTISHPRYATYNFKKEVPPNYLPKQIYLTKKRDKHFYFHEHSRTLVYDRKLICVSVLPDADSLYWNIANHTKVDTSRGISLRYIDNSAIDSLRKLSRIAIDSICERFDLKIHVPKTPLIAPIPRGTMHSSLQSFNYYLEKKNGDKFSLKKEEWLKELRTLNTVSYVGISAYPSKNSLKYFNQFTLIFAPDTKEERIQEILNETEVYDYEIKGFTYKNKSIEVICTSNPSLLVTPRSLLEELMQYKEVWSTD